MKFAIVMPYYLPDGITGGAEKQAYLLARGLVDGGHDVLFICLNPRKKNEVEYDDGVNVLRVLKRMGKLQFLDYPIILRELFRWKPDAVISRIRFYYLPVSLYALLKGGVSVAFIPEDSLTTPFPEVRKLLRRLRTVSPFKVPLAVLHAAVIDVLSQTGLVLSKRVVVQNDVQGRNVGRFFFRKSIKLPSIFVPPDVRVDKDKEPLIVWVGNAREEKRPEIFVGLAQRLPEYRFVMIGRKTERFKGEAPNLEALGELPHDRALEWLGKAWILVNTSAWEGFPNVFLEAWYLKTLVLTYNADPDNLISSGLGVKARDTEDASEKIKSILKDRERLNALVERAYRYVVENHLPEAVIPKLLNLLEPHP